MLAPFAGDIVTNFGMLAIPKIIRELSAVSMQVVRKGVIAFAGFVVLLLLSTQVVRPPDLHEFQSADFFKTSGVQTDPGDADLLLDLRFEQTLGGDLRRKDELDIHVYPNFLADIRRYAWYPYRPSDRLNVTPSWSSDVVSMTVNGKPHPLDKPITLSAKKHGREVTLVGQNADGTRVANYVVLVLPHTFPPLQTTITSADDVAPGIITGMQAAPGNPTFSPLRQLRLSLYLSGIGGSVNALKKASKQPFDDFLSDIPETTLDLENRVYLPYINFVLDQYGTPLQYDNLAPRTIYLPFTTSQDEGLLPEEGFIYKEIVMDKEDHFAEAITRSFIAGKGDKKGREVPRHLDQFDDGHHIDVTPWETIQNVFYRIHPKGSELINGDVLDANVVSTYVVELDRQGEVIWEWDSIDHFIPGRSGSYLPKDRYEHWDYFHTNGVRFTQDHEELLVSARYLRAIINVDYPSGDVNWVLADPANDINEFTFIGDPLGGIGSLHAAVMRGNELLVFDNGHYDTSEYREGSLMYDAPIETRHDYTRVVSYLLDTEAKTATYQREWTYSDILTRTAGFLMFVPNKHESENLLISWGSAGAFTEYDPENNLVMATDTGGLTYRFYKMNIDHWME